MIWEYREGRVRKMQLKPTTMQTRTVKEPLWFPTTSTYMCSIRPRPHWMCKHTPFPKADRYNWWRQLRLCTSTDTATYRHANINAELIMKMKKKMFPYNDDEEDEEEFIRTTTRSINQHLVFRFLDLYYFDLYYFDLYYFDLYYLLTAAQLYFLCIREN